MYDKFYGLTESPFRITPDPRFLYLGPAHREALATLIYGIRERKGIVALTGGVGTGKTTLLEGLFERLADDCTFIRIRDPKADFSAIVRDLLAALGLPSAGIDRSEAMKLLWDRLSAADPGTINPVLVIDEAQDVRDDVLEDFRLLSNLETHDRKLIQMLLVGQPEFRRRLEAPALEPLRQRVALSTTIHPLTLTECTAYVKHRLSVAGAESEGIFAIGAFEAIHDYARGIPRLINVVCDGALSMGYATGTRPIHAALVREVVHDLRGEGAPIPAAAPGTLSIRAPSASSTAASPRGRGWVAIAAATCTLVLAAAVGGPAIRRSLNSPRGLVGAATTRPASSVAPAGTAVPAPVAPTMRPPPAPEPTTQPPRDGSSAALQLEPAAAPAEPTAAPPASVPSEPVPSATLVAAGDDERAAAAPEPRFEGEPDLHAELASTRQPDTTPAVELQARITENAQEKPAALKRERELQRERERDEKARAAKEAKARAARERIAKLKATSHTNPSDEANEGDAVVETADVSQPDTPAVERSNRPATTSPAQPTAAAVARSEPKMVIVSDDPETGPSATVSASLKVRELYASHSVGVPEASPRFVPGETVQLVAVYELANAPPGGGDVSIDLWVRGPNQEDMPALGARRVLQGRSGTFQAAVGRKIPANAPSGVYGLVARVRTGGVEARRVFLFRVD